MTSVHLSNNGGNIALNWSGARNKPGDWIGLWDHEPSSLSGYLTWCNAPLGSTYKTNYAADGSKDYWIAYVEYNPSLLHPKNQNITAKSHYQNKPDDSNLSIGYYNLSAKDVHQGVLQHTFAKVTDSGGTVHNFQCYGGLSGDDQQFPAEIYQPYITGKSANETSESALLYAAAGIASFTTSPDASRTNFGSKTGGYNNMGDCSGLSYLVDGVCHQMCNRVMWAAAKPLAYTYANINYPPSLKISYAFYGMWGSNLQTMNAAFDLAQTLKGSSSDSTAPLTDVELDRRNIAGQKAYLETGHGPEARQPAHHATMTSAIGADAFDAYSDADKHALLQADLLFHSVKREVSIGLLKGTVSHDEAAQGVNNASSKMIATYGETLKPGHYKDLFGIAPGEDPPNLINRDHMPEDYQTLGDKLGL